MKTLSIILAAILVSTFATAQFKNYSTEDATWYNGNYMLSSGKKGSGELNYNFVNGMLKMRDEQGNTSFTPGKVAYFELEMPEEGIRLFYSLPADINEDGREVPVFFEVIYEKGERAILSRHTFDYDQNTGPMGASVNGYGAFANVTLKNEKVREYIYLLNTDGLIKYLEGKKGSASTFSLHQNAKYRDKAMKKSKTDKALSRYKVTNKTALKRFAGEHYKGVLAYARENDLEFRNMEELILLLDYLETL